MRIELLAPAKDVECGIAAIDSGADAVYIGAARFGARESAGNNLDDIAELVRHAHKFWAMVYVTVNTLLRDDEIPQAVQMIEQLHVLGIDGLIIQDAGLLECDLPPIPLIASTQMHNNTPERVAFLGQIGFRRAILARELTLDEISAIRAATDIELEFFVHGALCVCYSGQCYLSYALGGRSGNRGQCAQPCRKPYTLIDRNGKMLEYRKHLLSLRDLSLSGSLRDLIEAGVCSFKIEGRLKDKAYVTNVVSYYRRELDKLGVQRVSSGRSTIDFAPDLTRTFNRGYTDYFLHGRTEKIGSPDTPKMIGEPIGPVLKVSRRDVMIDTAIPLHNGDGITWFDRQCRLRGTVVNGVKGRTIVTDKPVSIEPGTMLYRNHDHEFLARLEKSRPERKIEIRLALRETPDGLELTAVDENGNTAEFALPCEKEAAQKPEQALESIRRQLGKTGGTDFEASEVNFELAEVPFVPISALNTIRRGVLEALAKVRESNRPIVRGGPVRSDFPYPATELTFEGNVLNSKAEEFYRRHGVTKIEPAAESGLDMRGRRVMTTRYCIKHQFGLCPKDGAQKLKEPLTLVNEQGNTLELRFDCAGCLMEVYLTNG
ncbi:MAG: U32 family peptidase [Armatimonadetes bacterium]|nr:U32 family peptidase [Armatimonadota bacterium]